MFWMMEYMNIKMQKEEFRVVLNFCVHAKLRLRLHVPAG